jgi:hypothetical protein
LLIGSIRRLAKLASAFAERYSKMMNDEIKTIRATGRLPNGALRKAFSKNTPLVADVGAAKLARHNVQLDSPFCRRQIQEMAPVSAMNLGRLLPATWAMGKTWPRYARGQ